MARFPFKGTWWDGQFKVIESGTITVKKEGSDDTATAYGSETGSALTNSQTTTNSSGVFEFWIDEADFPLALVALDDDATPSISGGAKRQRFKVSGTKTGFNPLTVDNITILPEHSRRVFKTGGTTTITDFDDGFEGLEIVIVAEHTLDITDGTNIFTPTGGNLTMNATDVLELVQKSDGKWYTISFSDNT